MFSVQGVIIFSRKRSKFWKISTREYYYGKREHHESNSYHHVDCGPTPLQPTKPSNIAWIALAPPCSSKNRTLLYAPESSTFAFGINVEYLKNEKKSTKGLNHYIYKVFEKHGSTSGVTYDSYSNIFIGMLSERTIAIKWAGKSKLMLCPNTRGLIRYPGKLAIDNKSGTLYISEMSSLSFATTGVDRKQVNFRVLALETGHKNYMYCSRH